LGKEKKNSSGVPVYKDLEEVINVPTLGAGLYANSKWFENVDWVRNIRLLAFADQNYDVCVFVRDSTGVVSSFNTVAIVNQATTLGAYRPHLLTGAQGYAIRIALKNVSAVTMTNVKVRAQLFCL
jgi:hypothetical protein